jgi:hypothetical protein
MLPGSGILARATKQFDKELVETRPMTAEERRRWKRAKRKPGRPRVGKGAVVISVSVEKVLSEKKTNKLAKKLDKSRAQLISRGLRNLLKEYGGE